MDQFTDDVLLKISSYLRASELVCLALTCTRFGSKNNSNYNRSLVEEAAMKNTAQEITKQMDNFEKKVAKENAASLEKIPDNVKKAIGKNKQQEKAAKEIGQAMAQGGASAADNVKKINEASNNPGRR